MDESLSDWLKLREPVDAASRSRRLTDSVVERIVERVGGGPVQVLDLATGAGSNLRYLMERLGNQRWLVVDRSETLLEYLIERTASWATARGHRAVRQPEGLVVLDEGLECHVAVRQMDLGSLDSGILAGRQLVTASALLDLVSESWLRSLANHCREARAAALFTITYNGRNTCAPADPEDTLVFDLFNRHQATDKGLGGPAAGPAAARLAARAFENAGYHVEIDESGWVLDASEAAMQRFLIDGWASAAVELAPEQAAIIAGWRMRRLARVDAGRSRIEVGHHDLAAWLATS